MVEPFAVAPFTERASAGVGRSLRPTRITSADSDTRRAKLAVTMPLPMTVSQVELLFTYVVDQITDIFDLIEFIVCNFHASKVL
jgi:hypothetical protein